MFLSAPNKRYLAYWRTLNGRVVLRKRHTKTHYAEDWELLVDKHAVGTGYKKLVDMVSANMWAIEKAL